MENKNSEYGGESPHTFILYFIYIYNLDGKIGCDLYHQKLEAVMNIFISQPMHGLSDEEILKAREAAKNDIKRRLSEEASGVYFIDSFNKPDSIKHSRIKMLAHSIMLLADADFCYFVPGWESSPGCLVEFLVCKKYGIPSNVFKIYRPE